MLLGYNYFIGTDTSMVFSNTNSIGSIDYMTNTKGIFDEIYIDEDITKTKSTTKDDWIYSTLFDAKFQNNLEAGNITNQGVAIEKIRFQKRLINTMTWELIKEMNFSVLQQQYIIYDKYIKNNYEYEYSILPITSNIEGKRTIANITPQYDGIWLIDKNNDYQLLFNIDMGTMEHNQPNSMIETLGSQYPIVVYSQLDYKKGTIKALVLSSQSINGELLNSKNEKEYRNSLMTFLKNKKPKVLKGINGDYMVISIVGTPTEVYNNDLQQIIADVEISYVEIDDILRENVLVENGLI